ncbi:hypothetical protein IV203_009711 [Nitzschia inconspicua]|uniref:Uncharacterized protein n=1 Tax=Nitzschia inconspicua TaxID=303405 RepID=A0A9K3PKQ3_9STRA|nr:hypothetical protein IV203_009711 [Nitzschia inconspicua]
MNILCSTTNVEVDDDEVDAALECDYDENVTTLYQAIESEAWVPVLEFLETGKWEHMFQSDPNPPLKQAQTWVTRFENGKVRWSLLPIHLAMIKNAPTKVISSLLNLHPLGAKSVDDQGSLPLHLAFKYGASDRTMIDLIQRFPPALFTKDIRGRVPTDIDGTQKERTTLLRAIIKATTANIESRHKISEDKKLNDLREDLILKETRNAYLENQNSELERRFSLLKTEFLKLRKKNESLLGGKKTQKVSGCTMQQSTRRQELEMQKHLDDKETRLNKKCSEGRTNEEPSCLQNYQLGRYDALEVIDNTGNRRSVPQDFAIGPKSSQDISTSARMSTAAESRSDNESTVPLEENHDEEANSFAATLRKGSSTRNKRTSRTHQKLPPAESPSRNRILGYKSTWTGNVSLIPEPHPGTNPRKTRGFFKGFSGQIE